MNFLDYTEQKLLLERLVIGLEEPILIKGIGQLQAKIDSGNGGYNVIHGEDLYQEGDILHFTTYDSDGNKKHVAAKTSERLQVNIGGGNIQDRPVVNLDVKFANTLYKQIPFSVTDRSDNKLPVLISKGFVENELEALIDVSKTNIANDEIQATLNESSGKGKTKEILRKTKKGIDNTLSGVGKTVKGITNTAKKVATSGAKGVSNVVKGATNAAGNVVKGTGKAVSKVGNAMNINSLAGKIANTAKQLSTGTYQGPGIVGTVGKGVSAVGKGVSAVGSGVGKVGKGVGSAVQGTVSMAAGTLDYFGGVAKELFTQQWIKDLAWGATLTTAALSHPYLLSGFALYKGVKSIKEINADTKSKIKPNNDQLAKIKQLQKRLDDLAKQHAAKTTDLMKEIAAAAKNDKAPSNVILQVLRKYGYKSIPESIESDMIKAGKTLLLEQAFQPDEVKKAIKDNGNFAMIINAIGKTSDSGYIALDSITEETNKARVIVQAVKSMNESMNEENNGEPMQEGVKTLIQECFQFLTEDGEEPAEEQPDEEQTTGEEQQTSEEQQAAEEQQTTEEAEIFTQTLEELVEKLNEENGKFEKFADEYISKLKNRQNFTIYYQNIVGDISKIKEIIANALNSADVKNELDRIYNITSEVKDSSFEKLITSLGEQLKNSLDEVFGTFIIVFDKNDGRHVSFGEGDNKFCIILKEKENGETEIEVLVQKWKQGVPDKKQFSKIFKMQNSHTFDFSKDVPSKSAFNLLFGLKGLDKLNIAKDGMPTKEGFRQLFGTNK